MCAGSQPQAKTYSPSEPVNGVCRLPDLVGQFAVDAHRIVRRDGERVDVSRGIEGRGKRKGGERQDHA